MTSSVQQQQQRKVSHFDETHPLPHAASRQQSTAALKASNGLPRKDSRTGPSRKPSTVQLALSQQSTSEHPFPRRGSQREGSQDDAEAARRQSRYRKESRMEQILESSRRLSQWRRPSGAPGSSQNETASTTRYHVWFQNSYQLAPLEDKLFNALRVEPVIKAVLDSLLSSEVYDERQTPSLAMLVTNMLKERVKELDYPRYKYVCNVTLVQLAGQGVRVASRGLWMTSTDRAASAEYCNTSMVAVATVFAVYCE